MFSIVIGVIGGASACGDDDPLAIQLPEDSKDGATGDLGDRGLDGSLDVDPDGSLDGGADGAGPKMGELGVECGALAPSKCVVQIGAGFQFACALFSDGHVRCWGDNGTGQCGTGEVVDGGGFETVAPDTVFPPVAIPGLHDVRQIALQARTVCAIDKDGRVFCWGSNQRASCGQPPTVARVLTPAQVPGLPGPAKNLLPTTRSICAELEDGQVWCWGDNQFGELGVIEGADAGLIAPPVRVPVLEGAFAGAAQNAYYVVQADGGILSFGINNSGMLGRGVGADVLGFDPHPAPVVGLPERAIAVGKQMGGGFQCAILESRAIACWGDNRSSQVAPDASAAVLTPTIVGGLGGVVEVASGGLHTCARISDGGLTCWGYNGARAVGQPSPENHPPTHVEGLGPIVQVVAGSSSSSFTCALERSGIAKCWGSSNRYMTGRPSDSGVAAHVPFAVAF